MFKYFTYALCLLSLVSISYAAKQAPIMELDIAKAKKLEIRQGQIGFRSTLLFFTFKDQKAILKIHINNKDTTFPIMATLYQFDQKTSDEGLKRWLSNQHSDGLFPEVPEPSNTIEIPKKVFKIAASKMTGESKQRIGNKKVVNYDVTLQASDYTDKTSYKLKGFKLETKVHVIK